MPRRARLSLPGVPLHLVQRGNNRQACFFAPDDCQHYLDWLEDHSRRQGCRVHAYVLMTNHVHLLVSADDPGAPSRVMKALGQRYVQYINRTYRRSGGLWEGRFRSCLVQQDDCLFACLRYIEMNPVRASMVEQPADYRWSSYRAHAHGAFDTLLTPHAAYLALGTNPDERQQRYRMLFREQLAQQVLEDILAATRGNFVLGNPKCAAEVAVALGRHALIRLHRRSASASIPSSWPVDVIDLHARMRRPSSNRTLRRHDHKSVRLADFPSARQGRFF